MEPVEAAMVLVAGDQLFEQEPIELNDDGSSESNIVDGSVATNRDSDVVPVSEVVVDLVDDIAEGNTWTAGFKFHNVDSGPRLDNRAVEYLAGGVQCLTGVIHLGCADHGEVVSDELVLEDPCRHGAGFVGALSSDVC